MDTTTFVRLKLPFSLRTLRMKTTAVSAAALLSLFCVAVAASPRSQTPVCPRGQTAVQRFGFELESNGCSKPSFIQVDGEEDFTHCCDRHGKYAYSSVRGRKSTAAPLSADACYQVCGVDKALCESKFQRCLKDMCARNFKANAKCGSAAQAYVMGVQLFGQGGFETSQEAACECVPSSGARDHYERLFREFYARHAPDRLEAAMSSQAVTSALVRVQSDQCGQRACHNRNSNTRGVLCVAGRRCIGHPTRPQRAQKDRTRAPRQVRLRHQTHRTAPRDEPSAPPPSCCGRRPEGAVRQPACSDTQQHGSGVRNAT